MSIHLIVQVMFILVLVTFVGIDKAKANKITDNSNTFIQKQRSIHLYGDRLETEELHHRTKRSAQRRKEYVWRTRIIPFVISDELAPFEKLIYSAMEVFHKHTCVKFKNKRWWHTGPWLVIKYGKVCLSSIGRQYWNSGPQYILLNHRCLNKATILHELMHTIGFWHEHVRPDRNHYVQILYQNIQRNELDNFRQVNPWRIDTLGTKYDKESILHYGERAFSNNGKTTIYFLNQSKQLKHQTLSEGDVHKINLLYQCENTGKYQKYQKRSTRINQYEKLNLDKNEWGSWSPCDRNCRKYRQRVCFEDDINLCGNVNKNGVETESMGCIKPKCVT